LLRDYDNIFTTLRALAQLRNLCAHQARIWNRRVITQVVDNDYLKKFGNSEARAQWRVISALMWLVDGINKNDEYSAEVLALCRSNPEFYEGLINPNL
jgi:abortive infection bacteriophage resistance protein